MVLLLLHFGLSILISQNTVTPLDWQLLIKHLVCMWSFSSLRFMHIITRFASVALVFAWHSKRAGFGKRRSDKQNVFVAGTVRVAYRKWVLHSLCLRKNTNMEEPGGSNSKMWSPIPASSNTLNQYLTASDTRNHRNLDVSYTSHPLKGTFKRFCQITNRKEMLLHNFFMLVQRICHCQHSPTRCFPFFLAQLREPTSATCIAEGLRIVKMLN